MPATPLPDSKWWAQSMTVCGALLTAAATVLPSVGPRFGRGFLEFYDVRVPFDPRVHTEMRGVILVAVFGFVFGQVFEFSSGMKVPSLKWQAAGKKP